MNTYAPSVVAGWTTPFESVREWQEKTAANTAFLAGPPCQDVPADRCPDAGYAQLYDKKLLHTARRHVARTARSTCVHVSAQS